MTPVMSKEELLERLDAHTTELKRAGVTSLRLFGSFSRGDFGEHSDVDLLIEFEPGKEKFRNYMQLVFGLEDLLGRTVELLTVESLSPYIGPHILAEAEDVAFRN